MADFAGLLRKTIDAQKNVTQQLRQRVYERARETIKRKLIEGNIPEAIMKQQINLLENAIGTVEAEYLSAESLQFEAAIELQEETFPSNQNWQQDSQDSQDSNDWQTKDTAQNSSAKETYSENSQYYEEQVQYKPAELEAEPQAVESEPIVPQTAPAELEAEPQAVEPEPIVPQTVPAEKQTPETAIIPEPVPEPEPDYKAPTADDLWRKIQQAQGMRNVPVTSSMKAPQPVPVPVPATQPVSGSKPEPEPKAPTADDLWQKIQQAQAMRNVAAHSAIPAPQPAPVPIETTEKITPQQPQKPTPKVAMDNDLWQKIQQAQAMRNVPVQNSTKDPVRDEPKPAPQQPKLTQSPTASYAQTYTQNYTANYTSSPEQSYVPEQNTEQKQVKPPEQSYVSEQNTEQKQVKPPEQSYVPEQNTEQKQVKPPEQSYVPEQNTEQKQVKPPEQSYVPEQNTEQKQVKTTEQSYVPEQDVEQQVQSPAQNSTRNYRPNLDFSAQKRWLKQATALGGAKKNNFDPLNGIFKTQSERKALAAAEKRRRIFWIIATLFVLLVSIILFLALDPFSKKNAPSGEQKTPEATSMQTEKQTQRLLPDGRETTPEPTSQKAEDNYPKSDTQAISSDSNSAKATLYLSQTQTQTEKIEIGHVDWTIDRDISNAGRDLGSIINANVSIPINSTNERIIMRLSIRPNYDETIPATYITSIIFVIPDDFPEGAVNEIVDLKFKGTEQIAGQQMIGTTNTKIGDNFFIFPMSSAGPFAETNLRMMRQMPWIRVVAKFKSGRTMELTFNKGDKGTQVFNNVVDEWLKQNRID